MQPIIHRKYQESKVLSEFEPHQIEIVVKKIQELIEKGMKNMPSVTALLNSGETPLSLVKKALSEFEVEVLYEQDVFYKCNCSKERIETALITLGEEELNKMADEMENVEVKCHFCDKVYNFSPKEVRNLSKN